METKNKTDDWFNKFGFWIAEQLDQNNDIIILITGSERSGKSSLSYLIGKAVSKWTKQPFDVDNYVWDAMDMAAKVDSLPKQSVIILDEGGFDLYSRRAMSRSNVYINSYLKVCGYRNQCIIICAPAMHDVDSGVKNRRAVFWFHVKRGWRGTKLLRGMAAFSSKLYLHPYGENDYWNYERDVRFPPMPADFEFFYTDAKVSNTKRKVEALRADMGFGNKEEKPDLNTVKRIIQDLYRTQPDITKREIKEAVIREGYSSNAFYKHYNELKIRGELDK